MSESGAGGAPTRILDLSIEGMTCASCAGRVERKLNRIAGAEASVNLATERARVSLPIDADDSVALDAVSAAGYTARVAEARHTPKPQDPAHRPASPTPAGAPADAPADHPDHSDHSDHSDHDHGSADSLRQRLLVSALLAVPVLVLSMVPVLQFTNWQWLVFALASPVAVWGAWPFHTTAFRQARHGGVGMDTLISLGVIASYAWSVYALFFGDAGLPGMRMTLQLVGRADGASSDTYLEVASTVTVFLLAGRYFEARARTSSGRALHALLSLEPLEARRLVDGIETRVAVAELAAGDVFVVRPGERIAADGVVTRGASAIDASMLTGESVPIEVGVGDTVAGGTLNEGGHLTVRATRVGADTQLAHIARLVEDAQTGKARVQRLADRVSAIFVPVVIGLALATLIGWLATGHPPIEAFAAAVATVIIACPCALGLATPTALLVGTGIGASRGIVIRGPQVIERAGAVDTVVFDKTGTLTTGSMALVEVVATTGETRAHVLRMAAAVEALSEHPVGRAIVAGAVAEEQSDGIARADDFEASGGSGVRALVDGHVVLVGRREWVAGEWAVDTASVSAAVEVSEASGRTAVVVAWDGRARGVVSVADTVRPTSAAALARLRERGLEPMMVTGDNAGAAAAVASDLGIERVISGVLPGGKLEVIRALQAEGRVVAMVGDGVNDSAALAGADVGIALAGGSDAALEAGDITVLRDDLRLVPDALDLSRHTLRTIKVNLFWAFAYNVAALPIAMLGLLNPVVAGLAMALSSLIVMGNSLLLRRTALPK